MAKDNEKRTVVRRVKASKEDSSAARTDEKVAKKPAPAKKKTAPAKVKAKKVVRADKPAPFFLLRPIFGIGRYVRYSWRELRQVRWTNRRSTWVLTLAVIIFCVFFATIIMFFDWIFNWIVQEVVL
jgi:preprotein translocase SecE subunit